MRIGLGLGLTYGVAAGGGPLSLAFAFGALTRANAGAVLPADASFGATSLTPTTATITTPDPVNPSHWAVISGNKLAPTINGGLAASYDLTVTYDGTPVAVTITTTPNTYSVASMAEFNTAAGLANAAPTTDKTILFRSATYTGLNVNNILMSGTLSGVPSAPGVFDTPEAARGQTWNPAFTGGQLSIGSHKPFGAKFSGASGLGNSTGIRYLDVVHGRLSSAPQYSYEPESSVGAMVTGITLGNPTIVHVTTSSMTVVGAKCRVSGITTGPTAMNGVHVDVLNVSGNDITVDYDSTGMPAWVAGGDWQGASYSEYTPAWTPSGSNSTFIFSGSRFSNRDLNPDAAYWNKLVVVGPYKQGVFYNTSFDGFTDGLSLGRGWQTWRKNLHFSHYHTDAVNIGASTLSTATPHTGGVKAVSAATQANPCVLTCTAHGLLKGDSFVVSSATGMTQLNNTPRVVLNVIDANTIEVGNLSTISDNVQPADSTAWGAYTGSGVLNGPLFIGNFAENIYVGPSEADARFTTSHSDAEQNGNPTSEIGMRGGMFDVVFNMTAPRTALASTQGHFGAGAENDATTKRWKVKNILTITTTTNGVMSVTPPADWANEMSYATALHHSTVASPTLGATYRFPSTMKSFGKSIICGDMAGNNTALTHAKTNVVPATDLNAIFDGNFTQIGGYWYDADPEPTGTVPAIIQEFANRYKGIGVCANMGFGSDPASPFFNGTVDGVAATISGVSVTPSTSEANLDWSCDKAAAFAYYVLSTSNSLTQADVIGAAMNGHASVVGSNRGVVGLTATGAQPVRNFTVLSPATTYYAYLVVETIAGTKTFSGSITVTTNSVAGVIQYLGEVERVGPAPGSISLASLGLLQNDVVVVFDSAASNSNARAVGVTTSGYANIVAKFASNDTYDCNTIAQWKAMSAVPDTDVAVASTGNGTDARRTKVRAYRYVDTTTPIDAVIAPVAPINGLLPNPGAITPVTADALICVFCAGAAAAGMTTAYDQPSDLTDWAATSYSSGSFSLAMGVGHHLWTGGAFDPETWTGPASNATDSCTIVVFALRPQP